MFGVSYYFEGGLDHDRITEHWSSIVHLAAFAQTSDVRGLHVRMSGWGRKGTHCVIMV